MTIEKAKQLSDLLSSKEWKQLEFLLDDEIELKGQEVELCIGYPFSDEWTTLKEFKEDCKDRDCFKETMKDKFRHNLYNWRRFRGLWNEMQKALLIIQLEKAT